MRFGPSRGTSAAQESGNEQRSTSAHRADTTKSANEPGSVLMQVRRHSRRWLLVMVGVAVLALGVTQLASATSAGLGAAPGSEAHCSLATLNGTYIMQAQGIAVGGPAQAPFGYAS